jgi:hypothetical protein
MNEGDRRGEGIAESDIDASKLKEEQSNAAERVAARTRRLSVANGEVHVLVFVLAHQVHTRDMIMQFISRSFMYFLVMPFSC